MSSLTRQALEQRMQGKGVNPANQRETTKVSGRVPMSVPQQKLQVPDIPGYHTHWMRGDHARLTQAKRAGYTFVEWDEVQAVETGLANGADGQGSTDLGSHVSVVAGGGDVVDGQAVRLYLMKIPLEYWLEDQEALLRRSEQVAAALRGSSEFTPEGRTSNSAHVYGRPENRNILQPRLRSSMSESE